MDKISTHSPLDEALTDARRRYRDRHPKSFEAHHQAKDVMPGGNTRSVLYHPPFPLRMVSGEGAEILDADGHRYLNLLGEYTAGLFGHSDPTIRNAIHEALNRGISLSAHNYYEIELATIICNRFRSIEKVRFTNSGTEANLMAIATAKFVSGKKKVLVFNGSYHGGLLSFTDGSSPINAPHEYIVGEFNNNDITSGLIRENYRELACVIVEPMMGAAGCIPAREEFLTMLRRDCDLTESILIFDEVMTSRLSPGGAQQLYQVTPDMTTLGKYIGGGLSFGAFGGRSDIMDVYNPEIRTSLSHAGTFNNNTLTMAAGCAAMDKVFTAEVALKLSRRGEMLRRELNNLAQKHSTPIQFTGTGSLMNLHGTGDLIECPPDLITTDHRINELIFLDLLERGYYIANRGFIALMLTVTNKELAGFLNEFEKVLVERKSVL